MARPRRSLLFELFAASQRARTLLAAAMEGAGLRPDEYAVYSTLVDGGPGTPTRMADAAGMPATTMSHYVRAMTERGHVRRVRNPEDGRSVLLTLTASGRAAHSRAAAHFEEANQRFLASLDLPDADVREMLRALAATAASAHDQLRADALGATG
jgi:DNA-binding MarR family transcriptional regulator